jgi:hypothetical protein
MATTTGNRLTLDPMEKCSNQFFSETTNQMDGNLQILGFLCRYKMEDGGYSKT